MAQLHVFHGQNQNFPKARINIGLRHKVSRIVHSWLAEKAIKERETWYLYGVCCFPQIRPQVEVTFFKKGKTNYHIITNYNCTKVAKFVFVLSSIHLFAIRCISVSKCISVYRTHCDIIGYGWKWTETFPLGNNDVYHHILLLWTGWWISSLRYLRIWSV